MAAEMKTHAICYAPPMFRFVNRMHEYQRRLLRHQLETLERTPAPATPAPVVNSFPWRWRTDCRRYALPKPNPVRLNPVP